LEIPLREIAERVHGEIIGDENLIIAGLGSLSSAGPQEISFFADPRYREELIETQASAVLVREETALFKGTQVVVSDPARAYREIAALFAPPLPRYHGISEQAVVHESSHVGRNASVYPLVYVGKEAVVGDDTVLFPGVFIGDRVRIGNRTVVYPNVSILQDCVIGADVILHAGTVIGSDGFGFYQEGSGSKKIPQIGIVQIDDEVEIGANNCIDRAALGRTWIQRGVKTDNFVHIGHNVVIGEGTIVVAQVGISGSVAVGRQVIIGPQAGLADHVRVGDGAVVVGKSGVIKSIQPGEVVSGFPTMPHRRWLKTTGLIQNLPEFSRRLRTMEKQLKDLENRMKKETD
jgi:UDP-3-O-[3-hydroxymyristoyl] glucosamine N-acyltransferase